MKRTGQVRGGHGMMASEKGKISFYSWRFSHYFKLESIGETNLSVTCRLCPGSKVLSTATNSNSNLLKHLEKRHASTKLAAKVANAASETESHSSEHTPTPPKQQRLEFERRTHSKAQVDKAIARYVVENMLPISTVESPAFRQIISMVSCAGGIRQMGRKTFSNYLEREYSKMEHELKKAYEELHYISTTADIWSIHNRSYLGVTAHWINQTSLKHEKAALACKRVKGSHTYDVVASEIDHIHYLYGLSAKVTATVTDNGSNFVKAFKMYQPPDDDSNDSGGDDDDDNEVTFTDVNDVLDAATEYGIVLPPHLRCASHTMNLVSCSDLEKWFTSNPAIKGIYRSATAKCTALWNKASRSTMASETVGEVFSKKLLVPCTTRWNSFHDAVARITEIPLTDLTTICDHLGLKCFSDRELQFLKEYCAITKPLTVALDILQGEDNCYYGTLLPTLEVLMAKTLEKKEGLTVAMGLPDAIVRAIKTRFAAVLESEDAMVAAASLPMFKLRWCKDQVKKEMVKGYLAAECHKVTAQPGPLQQPKVTTTLTPSTSKAQDFFNFEEDDDTFSSVESEIISYLRTAETEMDVLQQFPTIKEVSLKKNAATPSSAPVERLFSLGSLVLCPKRNKLKDKRFE